VTQVKKTVIDTQQNMYDFVCTSPCLQCIVHAMLKSNEACNKKRTGGTRKIGSIVDEQ